MVEYKIHKFQFGTESVAIAFAVELCGFPFEEEAARGAVDIHNSEHSMSGVLAWHFVGETLLDGRPVPNDGELLLHDGPLIMCESGLHASKRALDALAYAPTDNKLACRVLCVGIGDIEEDKLVCSKRTILWRVDATETLRHFARMCALDVAHLWNMPPIVRHYLETGKANIMEAAKDAARAAAWANARATARDAAWAPAWNATSNAAWAAAWATAGDAAWATAWNATKATAWDAVRVTPWDAAGGAAWDAAWDAARAAQNKRLTEMLITAAHVQD